MREAENSEVNIHLLRGSIGNPVVMEPVSSGSFKGLVSRSAGLLALRASIAPSVGSREGGMKDCDPTDGTPTACTVAWKGAPERWTARVARYLRS